MERQVQSIREKFIRNGNLATLTLKEIIENSNKLVSEVEEFLKAVTLGKVQATMHEFQIKVGVLEDLGDKALNIDLIYVVHKLLQRCVISSVLYPKPEDCNEGNVYICTLELFEYQESDSNNEYILFKNDQMKLHIDTTYPFLEEGKDY